MEWGQARGEGSHSSTFPLFPTPTHIQNLPPIQLSPCYPQKYFSCPSPIATLLKLMGSCLSTFYFAQQLTWGVGVGELKRGPEDYHRRKDTRAKTLQWEEFCQSSSQTMSPAPSVPSRIPRAYYVLSKNSEWMNEGMSQMEMWLAV